MKRSTVLTLIAIAIVLSFFVTPVGYWSKIWLMQLFSGKPDIVLEEDRKQIKTYNWKLKDADWNFFNFNRTEGRVALIHFWASWHLPSVSELADIQLLYDEFQNEVDFYVVTNEEREPVEEFLSKNKFTFPITYRIVGEPSPLEIPEPSGTYIISKNGYIVVSSTNKKDWYNSDMVSLLRDLTKS